ncbi:hypothetical protein CONPUDRAFT_77936 [Coniophora puteana RWD-64-598 SS2]|uniref:Uncharacterized protein n=1 Tax=Coniophora puteana (strain RWD-64-598) TaxID=741705 RepID=R7SER0_CONPW|nr:uncharacterized protein CONPUDRAFT_77936 [Coniophora puteana RWD-64-598 SS2]EIW74663.1 hypothetical protein CONPUDRAFT_77936 [Coniophora puteana RWD-64-598 SS2]
MAAPQSDFTKNVERDPLEQNKAQPPSTVAQPTRVDSVPQQGSTMPGDGSEVHDKSSVVRDPAEAEKLKNDPNVNVVEVPGEKPSFKDQVFGYAKVIQGKTLGKPKVQERGHEVLKGNEEAMPSK